ncbi:MAG: tripartite tricarboxylate transporter substrate binding protein [Hyphomicrobiales bacterium]|nr:tripartite tricarboxylate transporter substrate binding protein [Hyphomicrobiales bacterium]
MMWALDRVSAGSTHKSAEGIVGSRFRPNSGLPEFGTLSWPKSDTSDFGWATGAVTALLVAIVATALTLTASATVAWAQAAYPTRPVKIFCGFPAGTSLDIITRIYAQKLEEAFGQPFVVENRVGASGNLALETAARAAPDGYTLVTGGVTQTISMSLFKTINYDVVGDFEPVGFIGNAPTIVVVGAALGVKTVPELIALAKTRPGEITYGTAGVGTLPHMSGELFNLRAGVKLTHVPYRGTNQAVVDLIGGRLSMMFSPAPTIAPHMSDARLQLLATTSAERSSLMPSLPPLGDTPGLEGFDTSIWYSVWAPKGTPKEIVRALNAVLVKASATDAVKAQLATNGADPRSATPEALAAFVREEVQNWAKVVAASGVKID